MDFDWFDWDPIEDETGNTFKISQRFDPDEIEDAFYFGNPVLVAIQTHDEEGDPFDEPRYRVVANHVSGNPIGIVYVLRDGKLRPFSAFWENVAWALRTYEKGHPPAPVPWP